MAWRLVVGPEIDWIFVDGEKMSYIKRVAKFLLARYPNVRYAEILPYCCAGESFRLYND
jgi:hypothetical protein